MASKEVLRVLKEQRPRKLFKYLYQLPNFGVGRRFTRVIWKDESVPEGEERWGDPSSYWTITRVTPDRTLKSGDVWGVRTWKSMQIQSHRDTTMADHRLNPTLRHLQRCYRGEVDFKSIEKLDDVNLMHDLPASRVAEHREKVALRPDDVFVATYPKSGTTWMQQIVKLIACNGVETGVNHDEFVPWIDHMSLEEIESMPSPRFFKSHLPYQLMPGGGDPEKANGKYISVIRNPKDVAVSLYVFMQKVFPSDMAISWEEFLDKYCNGEAIFGTFYAHFLGWWEHRNAPNILIVTFEEMRRDLKSVVGRVCNFLGYNLSEQEIGKIAEQTVFDEMKTNPAANKDYIEPVTFGGTAFMRKGIVGDWRNMFTPKQSAMIDSLVGDKLHGTGLVFDYGLEN